MREYSADRLSGEDFRAPLALSLRTHMTPNPYMPESLPLRSIDWRRFRRLIGPSNAALARYDGILQAMINPEVLLSPLMTQEAVLSSRIEGTQATLEEVLEFEVSSEAPRERISDFREVLNYRAAMRAAIQSLEKRPICLNLMLEAHSVLLEGVRGQNKARGEIRREQNFIGRPGSTIDDAIYIPPEPSRLLEHMRNLEAYIHFDEDDRLVQLAVIHAQFELIHPFLDGNGRVGRMLMPLFLFEKGLLSSPMFYLSEYMESHRDEYYDGLGRISRAGDWENWISFFLTAVLEQAKINTAKAKQILSLYEQKKVRVADLTKSQYAIRAVDAIFDNPFMTPSSFIKNSSIPAPSARRILKKLTDAGVLVTLRESRGSRPPILAFRKLIAIAQAPGQRSDEVDLLITNRDLRSTTDRS